MYYYKRYTCQKQDSYGIIYGQNLSFSSDREEKRAASGECARIGSMFYEFKHSLAADYCRVESASDFSFPAHMHHCFEWIKVTEGTMQVTVDEKDYMLTDGESVLIFPNQIHSMESAPHSHHFLCLFSPRLIRAYTEKTTGKIPTDNRFTVAALTEETLRYAANENPILLKGLLYTLCGTFDKTAVYRSADNRSDLLLYRIFLFIEENYHTDASLTALSHQLGYDYGYLSRYFKKTAGISYNNYVSQYRISKVCYLLQNEEMTVLTIAVECGFNSLRSLNRQFHAQLGMTPTEYRRMWMEKTAAGRGS